jgi:hypothetical protein
VRRMVTSHRVENDFARQTGFILRLSSHGRSKFTILLPALPGGLCNSHIWDRRDGACGVRGSLDKGWFAAHAAHRARAVCRDELWNVAV